MAVLPDADRTAVGNQWMRDNNTPLGALTKAELRAAVNAMDQWIDDNASAFNTSIPQPARAQLTAKQKAWLFSYVIKRRFEVA